MTKATIEAVADSIVRNEVHLCLSYLVSTLASGSEQVRNRDLAGLCEQAAELSYPIYDYEEAAKQAGWVTADMTPRMVMKLDETTGRYVFDDGWEEACDTDGIDPYEWEVFEHWAVSSWLAEKLQAKGEKVDTDFAGLNVWARTTTGQAISMDCCIKEIAAELGQL